MATTAGHQRYSGPVNLLVNTELITTNNANITFDSTINGAHSLRLISDGTSTFAGAVGQTAALSSLYTDESGVTAIQAGTVTTSGAQTYNDPVVLLSNTTLNASALTFNHTLKGNDAVVGRNLTIHANSGDITFNGALGDHAAKLGALVLQTDANNVFNAPVTAESIVTDSAGAGVGQTHINGGTITTSGTQTFHDEVLLQSHTTLNASALTFNQKLTGNDAVNARDLTVNASSGDITFNQALGESTAKLGAIVLQTAANNVFNAPVLAASIVTDSAGAGVGQTQINGGTITTSGTQTYHDAVVLQSHATLQASGLSFSQSVTGNDPNTARNLTINATDGNATFHAIVGANAGRLGLFNVSATGNTTFHDLISVAHLETGNAGKTYFNNSLATTTSQASMVFGNDVVIAAPAFTFDTTNDGLLGSGANITFSKTLSSDSTGVSQVVIQAGTAGVANFLGAVGQDASAAHRSLSSLTVSAGGGIVISGGTMRTSGVQNYNNPVTLGATTTLIADQINWGRVTATAPAVGLTLMSQGAQVLTDISITGDLNVTTGMGGLTGGVSQSVGSVLNIAGASTFTADTKTGQVAQLARTGNIFGGALSFVSARGGSWFTATVVSSSALKMGSTTVTGDLSLKATGGDITQVGGLVVAGKTDMIATTGAVLLDKPSNNFIGLVNVESNGALNLTTQDALTLGAVKTGGDTVLNAAGKVDLGTSTYGGKLKVVSGGFEIKQSGPVNFGGDTNFDAGTAKIDLFNPFNRWKGSIVY